MKEINGKYYLGTTQIGTFNKKIKENNILFKERKIEEELGKQIRDVVMSIDLMKKEISLIEENEKQINFDIDLYTIYDEKLKEYSYQKTTIIPIKVKLMEKWFQCIVNFKEGFFTLFLAEEWKREKLKKSV